MMTTKQSVTTPDVINDAMSYDEYRNLIDDLLAKGRSTGGRDSESIVDYTKMNVHRMNRLDNYTEIKDSLKTRLNEIDRNWIWLVLTEGWCGDAAQNIPPIKKMAEISPGIELKLILRDEHPEIMDEYLTDGTRSIPKLIALDAETLEEIGTWGPRPKTAQNLVQEWKHKYDKKTWAKKLHKWYAENKTRDIQEEFETLIEEWS